MKVRGTVLAEAAAVINGERQNIYGNPEDSFSLIAEYWGVYMDSSGITAGELRNIEAADVAMMMTLFKIAREANQYKRDNTRDACGYLGLYADMKEEEFEDDREEEPEDDPEEIPKEIPEVKLEVSNPGRYTFAFETETIPVEFVNFARDTLGVNVVSLSKRAKSELIERMMPEVDVIVASPHGNFRLIRAAREAGVGQGIYVSPGITTLDEFVTWARQAMKNLAKYEDQERTPVKVVVCDYGLSEIDRKRMEDLAVKHRAKFSVSGVLDFNQAPKDAHIIVMHQSAYNSREALRLEEDFQNPLICLFSSMNPINADWLGYMEELIEQVDEKLNGEK